MTSEILHRICGFSTLLIVSKRWMIHRVYVMNETSSDSMKYLTTHPQLFPRVNYLAHVTESFRRSVKRINHHTMKSFAFQ